MLKKKEEKNIRKIYNNYDAFKSTTLYFLITAYEN